LFCKDSLLLGNDGHFARTYEPVTMSPCSAEKSRFDYSLTQNHISEERNPQLHRFENLWSLTVCIKFEAGHFNVRRSPQACKDWGHVLVLREEVRMGHVV
jgi:hypothetical protein